MKLTNSPAILAIATAVPTVAINQEQYVVFVGKLLDLNAQQYSIMQRFAQRSEIKNRHTVIQDFCKERPDWTFFDAASSSQFPSTHKRNELYKIQAPKLSFKAAHAAIRQWGRSASDLSHVIYASCTGLMAPGIEFLLLHELGLKSSTQRLAINFMGCFGAFRALAVAKALAEQDHNNRILIVCTELCSLHMQPDQKLDTIIGNALFADGSAAMIVGVPNSAQEKPLWEIVNSASAVIENSPDAMTWDISNHGFIMRLSAEVPQYLAYAIKSFARSLLNSELNFADADWPIHPGGKAVLTSIEQACQLDRAQTSSSWDVLANYGNMSSASFPFVIKHCYEHGILPWAVGLGFGPGLSVEGVLLKRL